MNLMIKSRISTYSRNKDKHSKYAKTLLFLFVFNMIATWMHFAICNHENPCCNHEATCCGHHNENSTVEQITTAASHHGEKDPHSPENCPICQHLNLLASITDLPSVSSFCLVLDKTQEYFNITSTFVSHLPKRGKRSRAPPLSPQV